MYYYLDTRHSGHLLEVRQSPGRTSRATAGRALPVVGDVDDQAAVGAGAGHREDAERQAGADAEADRGLPFEAAAVRDLAEGAVAGDVAQFALVRGLVRRPIGVV